MSAKKGMFVVVREQEGSKRRSNGISTDRLFPYTTAQGCSKQWCALFRRPGSIRNVSHPYTESSRSYCEDSGVPGILLSECRSRVLFMLYTDLFSLIQFSLLVLRSQSLISLDNYFQSKSKSNPCKNLAIYRRVDSKRGQVSFDILSESVFLRSDWHSPVSTITT